MNIPNQYVDVALLQDKGVTLCIKREDTIHPLISGNKYRKLAYNLLEAQKMGRTTLLTFGGAFSNHIAAVACAGHEKGFRTVGIIRGEELEDTWPSNPTLSLAHKHGMQLHFVSRSRYRKKSEPSFLNAWKAHYGNFYVLPEGGTNTLAVKGCEEILTEADAKFDVICCSVGTGGTVAGLINSAKPHQQVLGFSALKGDFLKETIQKLTNGKPWQPITDFHFGGYAKIDADLVHFINTFKKNTGIPLDPIYTGKLLFGIFELIKQDFFSKGTQILAIHTGGLQGITGMNQVFKKKNLPLLDIG
ncbi:1-aminocyclopropane-1-carboxylate deaminase/D-cysteine desulfhydrase [Flagellimonas meishanensis]|uniref:1-aminocyclopropane-1-carboxylate deaminase/D-cysteine desulfhydrase n=1 Tax=Flagellimonas meishanensis TaxID=2873264 RepID=UPI001CA69E82|nr:pyridoxal-phosphate dependent enzyme [[Muricauda] meishanensis]